RHRRLFHITLRRRRGRPREAGLRLVTDFFRGTATNLIARNELAVNVVENTREAAANVCWLGVLKLTLIRVTALLSRRAQVSPVNRYPACTYKRCSRQNRGNHHG